MEQNKVFVLSLCLSYEPGDEIVGVYSTYQAAINAQNSYANNDYYLRGRLDCDGYGLLIQEFELKN